MCTCNVRGCQKPPVQVLIWTAETSYYGTLHRFCEDHKISDRHEWVKQLVIRDE